MKQNYKDFEEAKLAYEKAVEELHEKRQQLDAIRKEMLSLFDDIKIIQAEMKEQFLSKYTDILKIE